MLFICSLRLPTRPGVDSVAVICTSLSPRVIFNGTASPGLYWRMVSIKVWRVSINLSATRVTMSPTCSPASAAPLPGNTSVIFALPSACSS